MEAGYGVFTQAHVTRATPAHQCPLLEEGDADVAYAQAEHSRLKGGRPSAPVCQTVWDMFRCGLESAVRDGSSHLESRWSEGAAGPLKVPGQS